MSDDDSFDPFEFDHVIDPFGMTENDFFDASDDVLQYDNMGCRVFVRGGTKVERFLPKAKYFQSFKAIDLVEIESIQINQQKTSRGVIY